MNTTLQSQLAPLAEECRQQLLSAEARVSTSATHEASVPEKEILAALGRALKAWETSAEGRATLQAMEEMSLEEIQQQLITLLQSQIFVPTLELISMPSLSLQYPIQTISIGAKFEANFILFGFAGTIGVATDPRALLQAIKDGNPSNLQFSTFISGWIDEGLGAGAFVGIEAGISGSEPTDLGGFATGIEASVVIIPDPAEGGVGIGISAQYYHGSAAESWGATIAIATGVDATIEGVNSYTILLTERRFPAIYQPTPTDGHMVIISIIECVNSNENSDQVYFFFTPDGGTQYRYPTWDHRKMSEANDRWDYQNTWYTGRSVLFTDSVAIDLWSETTGNDDSLGGLTFSFDSSWALGEETMLPQIKTNNGINDIIYNVWVTPVY